MTPTFGLLGTGAESDVTPPLELLIKVSDQV